MEAYIPGVVVGVAALVGWLVTQTQARAKAQREELRWRRKSGNLNARYIYRLEQALSAKDIPLPEHPEGWDEMEANQW